MQEIEKINFKAGIFVIINLIVLCISLNSCNTSIIITNNSYENKTNVLINKDIYEQTNSCIIHINYPLLHGLKNREIQNKINNQLKNDFLADVNNYCFENNIENVWVNIEKTYNFYVSNNLLSIISNELTSSNVIASNTIKDYNIDLKTGTFLTSIDLFNPRYKDDIVSVVLDDIFLKAENPHNKELYDYYFSIKEDVFYRLHIQILENTVIFMFKGTSNIEPIYRSEIPKKKIKKYITKKYI